jgi:hypothetical protein
MTRALEKDKSMTDAKQSDKPNDPAYSGGEDEGTKKSQSQPSEPPVDESDEGPSSQ